MTMIQAMKPDIVEILLNHWNTVAPVLLRVRKASNPTAQVLNTAANGIPRLVVALRNLGACPDSAMENSTREPEYRNAFPADHAEVSTAALIT